MCDDVRVDLNSEKSDVGAKGDVMERKGELRNSKPEVVNDGGKSGVDAAKVEGGLTSDGLLFHTKTAEQVHAERQAEKDKKKDKGQKLDEVEAIAPEQIGDDKIAEAVKREGADEATLAQSAKRLKEIIGILYEHKVYREITPQSLCSICEALGPTYVKMGQIMSMRSDILPKKYCEELTKLRSEVPPMTMDEVRGVVEGEYKKTLEQVFDEFKSKPLGSASIAQAHLARLHDSDSWVVLKVQRPGIREMMESDIALLRKASALLKLTEMGGMVDFDSVLDEMWSTAQDEMDFTVEAKHLDEFRENNKDFTYIACPTVEHRYTTQRVLMMEYIAGFQIDDVEGLKAAGYDLDEIALKLAENYMSQILDAGYFHADPHPGNIRVRDGKIVFIDFGMMGRLSKRDRSLINDAVQGFLAKDISVLRRVIMTMGVYKQRPDQFEMNRVIGDMLAKYSDIELGNMDMGLLINEVMDCAKGLGVTAPNGYTMLGRGVMTIEGVLTTISPNVNLLEIMSARLTKDMKDNVDIGEDIKKGLAALWLNSGKIANMPVQASNIMDMIINGETKLNFDLTGSEKPIAELHRMADRIVSGLIIAALIIGGSWMTSMDSGPEIFGIPVHAFIAFLIAIVLGANILFGINKEEKKKK